MDGFHSARGVGFALGFILVWPLINNKYHLFGKRKK